MDSHGYPKPIEIGQHVCYIMAIMALYVTLWHHFIDGGNMDSRDSYLIYGHISRDSGDGWMVG